MRSISVDVPVKAPGGFTLAFVSTYLQERTGDGDRTRLTLKVPLHSLAGTILQKPVSATASYHSDPFTAQKTVYISWSAEDSAAFPTFQGAFTVDEKVNSKCQLSLSGTYDPPGGAAGTAFDSILGIRIARVTFETLLEEIGQAAEADYATRLRL